MSGRRENGPYQRPRVKICGLTSLSDALEAVRLGADALGFIFAQESPRRLDPEAASDITAQIPPLVTRVGVFKDQDPEWIREVVLSCNLHIVQLHGSEPPEYCQSLDIDYIKALGVKIHSNVRIGRDVGLDTLSRQGFNAILIAIGAQKSAMLNIRGSKLSGIIPALQFLGEAKRRELVALSGKVWVIGGGAVAMDCARTALRLGASEVHAACLECRADMPAYDWEIEEADREGVNIHPSLAPQRFTSKGGSRVSGIDFKRVASTSLDSEGRISWTLVEGPGSDLSVECDTVIVAVGQTTDMTGLSGGPINISRGGAVVVNEESCIGTRYFKDLIDEDKSTIDDQLDVLTDRYMQIDCSCFTPNDDRIDQILKEYKDSNAQGILHYSLQFCHTYNIEEIKVREMCEKEGIPYLSIESDYSPEDVGQLQTRIEAFLEQIRG